MSPAPARPKQPLKVRWDMSVLLMGIYGLGVVSVLGYRLIGSRQTWFLEKNTRPLPQALSALLPPSPASVRILISPDIAVPMTWGVRRPVIAFPVACETWSLEAGTRTRL